MEFKLKELRKFETDCTMNNLYNKFEDGKLTIFVKSLFFCGKEHKNIPIYTFKQNGTKLSVEYYKTDISDLYIGEPGDAYFEGYKLIPELHKFIDTKKGLTMETCINKDWDCIQYDMLCLSLVNYSYSLLYELKDTGKFSF